MNLLTISERIELLKNLLADPDDWVSREILRLNEEAGKDERMSESQDASNIQQQSNSNKASSA